MDRPTTDGVNTFFVSLAAKQANLKVALSGVGGDELLLDDSIRLAETGDKAGVDMTVDIFPGMQHTFTMAAGRAPESDESLRRFAEWAKPFLGL